VGICRFAALSRALAHSALVKDRAKDVHGSGQDEVRLLGLSLAVEHVESVGVVVLHGVGKVEASELKGLADFGMDSSNIKGETVVEEDPQIIVSLKGKSGRLVVDERGMGFDTEAIIVLSALVISPSFIVDGEVVLIVDGVDAVVLV